MSIPGDEGAATPRYGVVAIGRNEGARLAACLASVAGAPGPVVYVDSGSTDGSAEAARRAGAEVVDLDLSTPFTAARARNEGLARLVGLDSSAAYVLFVDGDCEVVEGFAAAALSALEAEPGLAVACGRRRERHPGASAYNRLCDLEWDTPVGEARACGGDAMMRVSAVAGVGGFDASLIAGEEPELCVRLRAAGWRVRRLGVEMTRHDAAMTRFGQWWRRNVRAGHAFAEGSAIHGRPPERHWVREARSNWVWGLGVPSLAVLGAWPTSGLSLGLLGAYLLPGWRAARHRRRSGASAADARLFAFFCMLGKLPQAQGQLRYWARRLSGRRGQLIEYKHAATPPPEAR